MRQIYKPHGKHCYLRSFKTSCPRCGNDVLYWECTHGCKVFFQYPPYGKLIRHICKSYKGKSLYSQNKYPVIIKKPKGLLEKASPSCPACGKLFKTELYLKEHLKQLKKSDLLHKLYFGQEMIIKHGNKVNNKKLNEKMRIRYKPIFGKINIKKKNDRI